MIKQGINDSILEKKYKILRTSIMLGNIRNREEMLSNYEETAKEVDKLRHGVYEELLASKMYTTTTLEEEADRLKDLTSFIENRITERNEFQDDYIKITSNFLDDLPKISMEDELDDYRLRLDNILEYLNNSKEIEVLNGRLKELRDTLQEKYENKANNEIINQKLEDELIDEYNKIISRDDYYASLNYMDIDAELVKVSVSLNDKLEVMNTFISSYDALKNAGISGAEREEYLSYVSDAKKDYYVELEKMYMLNIYKLVLDKENDYDALYQKRDKIANLLKERLAKRNELEITSRDELEYFAKLCNEQFSIIKSQKYNIENIDRLILEISDAETRLEELDKANNREEIVALLDEFSVDKRKIEKIELPKEEIVHNEVIKKNNDERLIKPSNMVVKISEPVKINVRNAVDTAKLVMKKVVIVLEPKKFNGKRDKIKEAEKELEERKKRELELNKQKDLEKQDDIFVTFDSNNETASEADDVFITTSNQGDISINLDTNDSTGKTVDNAIKINVPSDNVSIPTEIFIEQPKKEENNLFNETDPFLDDNQFEINDKEKQEGIVSDMPTISGIGTVKPNNMLAKVEATAEENKDIILPTMGLAHNDRVDVPIVSENYIK